MRPRSTTPPTTLPAIIPVRVLSLLGELSAFDDGVSVLRGASMSDLDGAFMGGTSVFDVDEADVEGASVAIFVVALADADLGCSGFSR